MIVEVATEQVAYIVNGFVAAMLVAFGSILLRSISDFFKVNLR